MISARRQFALAVLMGTVLWACGSGNKVGEGIDLEKIQGKGGQRLGEKAPVTKVEPTTQQTKVAIPTSSPTKASPGPTPSKQVIQIFLIRDHPYYQVEGLQPGNEMTVAAGVILRWVNKEPEIDRQPFSPDLFECPRLKPGGTCDFPANVRGKVQIQDKVKVFATGILEMN